VTGALEPSGIGALKLVAAASLLLTFGTPSVALRSLRE